VLVSQLTTHQLAVEELSVHSSEVTPPKLQ
jgi:hypothetical protein